MLMIPTFISSSAFATESEICGFNCLMAFISTVVFNLVVLKTREPVSSIAQHFHPCINKVIDFGKSKNLTPTGVVL